MSKLADPRMYKFTVTWMGLDGLTQEAVVTAAYFQEAGPYTVFKDVEHAVVEAHKTDLVTRIARAEQPVGR